MRSRTALQSPRMSELLSINVYYLGITTLAQTMTPLVIPLLVQQFVGQDQQAALYGNLRLWTLMVAILTQSLFGMISDRSTIRWGKRKPFILAGTLLNLAIIILIGYSASLHGFGGYWILFTLVILLMIAVNIAQGALQGFIPDLVPESSRGIASGIKALFEIPFPLILVALLIGPLVANDQLWSALLVLVVVLVVCMLLTMLVREGPPQPPTGKFDWKPYLRLLLMTGAFTGVILVMGGVVKISTYLLPKDLALNPALIIFGIIGLVTMLAAIGLGVIISIQIGLGSHADRSNINFTWWVINRLAFLAASTSLASFALFFLQGRLGFTKEEAARPASLLLLVVGMFILLTALPSGWVSDWIGYKPVIALSGIIAAIGVGIIILPRNLIGVYAGAVLVGIATGIFYTTNWALGTKIVPRLEAGRYLGISNLAGAGAGAAGAFIGGPVADHFTTNYPSHPGIGYVVLFAIYGILFLFSVIALRFVEI